MVELVIDEVRDLRLPIEDDEGEWTGSEDGLDVDAPASRHTTDAELRAAGFVMCPAGCGAWLEPRADWLTGVPELDRTPPRGAVTIGADGSALSREHVLHRAKHRFRCACGADFCAACRAVPYHDGLTCEEHARPPRRAASSTPDRAARRPGAPRAAAAPPRGEARRPSGPASLFGNFGDSVQRAAADATRRVEEFFSLGSYS